MTLEAPANAINITSCRAPATDAWVICLCARISGQACPDGPSNVELASNSAYAGPDKDARALSERRNPSQPSSATRASPGPIRGSLRRRSARREDRCARCVGWAGADSSPAAARRAAAPGAATAVLGARCRGRCSARRGRRRRDASAGASLLVAGCLVVLACAAIALGWRFGENGRVGARRRDRAPHERAQTRAVGARDRSGGDRSAPVDGGRVQRRGHRRAHRADRALLGAAGRTHRHGLRVLRAPAPRGAAARRRQGGDPRCDPAEARAADAGGARDRRDPRRGGPPPRARLVLVDPGHGGDDRAEPPGEVGRDAATRAA